MRERRVPALMSCPISQHRLMLLVKYARSATGMHSVAYVVLSVWKMPQGIPQRICDARSIGEFREKKAKNMDPVRKTREPSMTFLFPNRSVRKPLKKRPMISPVRAPLVKAACHEVPIEYPCDIREPKSRLNDGNAKKLVMSMRSNPSITRASASK